MEAVAASFVPSMIDTTLGRNAETLSANLATRSSVVLPLTPVSMTKSLFFGLPSSQRTRSWKCSE